VILRSRKSRALRGSAAVPGDKSVSHRAALLAAMAEGESRLEGFLQAGVTRAMLNSLSAAGVQWSWENGALAVKGLGRAGFQPPSQATGGSHSAGGEPARVLNCGNSAATIRMLAGALAGRPPWARNAANGEFVLDGSPRLRERPMKRIIEPLGLMGARIRPLDRADCAPLAVAPSELAGIDYSMPVASAQVKSAVLLAGLSAHGPTAVEEPFPSRDHTERMFRSLGVTVDETQGKIRVCPIARPLPPMEIRIVGDFSSAAFFIAAASIIPGSDIVLRGVGLNPRRTGLLAALRRMGARIEEAARSESAGEPLGDLRIRFAHLAATAVEGSEVVDMIDEFPVFAVAAAFAEGVTEVRQAAELRHKESDRIAMLASELRALGIRVEE
jgi:3-phosphoshikimate 1-carboxyvinyltransferase